MSLIEIIHGGYIHKRRIRVLAERLAPLLPQNASVLDVGCGDGLVDELILKLRPDISIRGIEIQSRPQVRIEVRDFDGTRFPFNDKEFDAVIFVDVLHHTDDPMVLLREAARVARSAIVIKDHFREGFLAGPTLRFMDRVGNARYGVPLPHNYWTPNKWRSAFQSLGLAIQSIEQSLRLYPWPANMLFDRSLHFVAKLQFDKEHNGKEQPG